MQLKWLTLEVTKVLPCQDRLSMLLRVSGKSPPDSGSVDSVPVCLGILRTIFTDSDYFSKVAPEGQSLDLNRSKTSLSRSVGQYTPVL